MVKRFSHATLIPYAIIFKKPPVISVVSTSFLLTHLFIPQKISPVYHFLLKRVEKVNRWSLNSAFIFDPTLFDLLVTHDIAVVPSSFMSLGDCFRSAFPRIDNLWPCRWLSALYAPPSPFWTLVFSLPLNQLCFCSSLSTFSLLSSLNTTGLSLVISFFSLL